MCALSGGNQQKVVVARELSRPLKVLVASQPTRGLDVGAIEFVHKRLIDERDRGTAVVIVSTELDEVVALADRIAVMYDGRIVGIVPPDTSREVIGLMMAGAIGPAMSTRRPPMPDATTKPEGAGLPEEQQSPTQKADVRSPVTWLPTVKVTAAAFVLALLVGALLIVFSDRDSIEALGYFFDYPWDFFRFAGEAIGQSYWALLTGAVGSGRAISQTLERAAPLICAGLGVGLAFRAGLFNIGAQGQMIVGAIAAGYVGSPGTFRRACTCSWRSSRACSAARCGASSPASSRPRPAPTRSSRRSCSTTWRRHCCASC